MKGKFFCLYIYLPVRFIFFVAIQRAPEVTSFFKQFSRLNINSPLNQLQQAGVINIEDINIGAGGLGFNFRASQIGHIVANGLQPLQLRNGVAQATSRRDRPATR